MTTKKFDTYSGLVALVALTQGLIPFITSINALHWTPVWSIPRQLDSPLRWVVSALVLVVAVAVIALLEARKKQLGASAS